MAGLTGGLGGLVRGTACWGSPALPEPKKPVRSCLWLYVLSPTHTQGQKFFFFLCGIFKIY